MKNYPRLKTSSIGLVICISSLIGCQHSLHRRDRQALSLGGIEKNPKLSTSQVADVKVALGRSLEKRGDPAAAAAAYVEALKHDPGRSDAYLRLAILHDQQGKFTESLQLYRKALAARPGNPDIYCNMGYSLALQGRWAEAEMNLRQTIALQPDHPRAHNNLGLVLAHRGRWEEALAEFRRAGCSEAEAHTNLAFVLTLERSWPEAQEHYQLALADDPSLVRAEKGFRELKTLMAKAGSGSLAPSPRITDTEEAAAVPAISPASLTVPVTKEPAGKD